VHTRRRERKDQDWDARGEGEEGSRLGCKRRRERKDQDWDARGEGEEGSRLGCKRRRERKDQDWDAEASLQELNNEVPPSSSARWFVALPSPLRTPYKAVATVLQFLMDETKVEVSRKLRHCF
jgi:hypothetical protein